MKKHLPLTQEVVDNKNGFKLLSYEERDDFIIENHDLVFDKVIEFKLNFDHYFHANIQMKCTGCGFVTSVKSYTLTLKTEIVKDGTKYIE